MPRVTKHMSQGRAAGTVRCARCPEPIVKGQEYYQWAIKAQRGGTVYRQHTSHGPVRQSQLTHSKMSGAYAAIEAAEDSIAAAGSVDELEEALNDCISEIESVRDEYQESLDNMPEGLQQGDTGQQIQEKIDELESFIGELESARDTLESFDEPEPPENEDGDHAQWEEDRDGHLETQRTEAEGALASASF